MFSLPMAVPDVPPIRFQPSVLAIVGTVYYLEGGDGGVINPLGAPPATSPLTEVELHSRRNFNRRSVRGPESSLESRSIRSVFNCLLKFGLFELLSFSFRDWCQLWFRIRLRLWGFFRTSCSR